MYFKSHDASKGEHKRSKERALLQWEKLRPVCKSASKTDGDDGLHLVAAGPGPSAAFAAAASAVHSLSLHVKGKSVQGQARRYELQPARPKFLRQKSDDNPAVLPPLSGAVTYSSPKGGSDIPQRISPSNGASKPHTSEYSCRDFSLPDVPSVSPTPLQSQNLHNPSVQFAVSSYKKHAYAEQKLTEIYKENLIANKFKDWAHKKQVCLPVLKEIYDGSQCETTSRIHSNATQAVIYTSDQNACAFGISYNGVRESVCTLQKDANSIINKCQDEDATKELPTFSAEIHKSRLVLRGKGCSTCLYKNWSSRTIETITTVQFFEVDFNEIARNLSKLTSRFPGLLHVEFFGTNITSFQQLSCLGLLQLVNSLVIGEETNPVTELSLWKAFVIHIMNGCSLKWLNGKEVTVEDTNQAIRLFRGYVNAEWAAQKYVQAIHSHQSESRDSMLGDEEEEKHNKDVIEALKYEVNPRMMTVAKFFVDDVQKKVVLALKLHNLLVKSWPQIFKDTVAAALDDFGEMDAHMKACMEKLLNAGRVPEL